LSIADEGIGRHKAEQKDWDFDFHHWQSYSIVQTFSKLSLIASMADPAQLHVVSQEVTLPSLKTDEC